MFVSLSHAVRARAGESSPAKRSCRWGCMSVPTLLQAAALRLQGFDRAGSRTLTTTTCRGMPWGNRSSSLIVGGDTVTDRQHDPPVPITFHKGLRPWNLGQTTRT